METFLDAIRKEKHIEVAARRKLASEEELREKIASLPPTLDFISALGRRSENTPGLIAEVKLKAPGVQNIEDLQLASLLKAYANGGATAISVLTDARHFGGSLGILQEAREETTLPILQKEFIVEPYQLIEGRVAGADAALLLVHYFSQAELRDMIDHCLELGITPVVECSRDEEVARAIACNPQVLLLNNRPISSIPANPKETYSMGSIENAHLFWDKHASIRRWKEQADRRMISASCISSAEDITNILSRPYDTVLVGNAAASNENPENFLRDLLGLPQI